MMGCPDEALANDATGTALALLVADSWNMLPLGLCWQTYWNVS